MLRHRLRPRRSCSRSQAPNCHFTVPSQMILKHLQLHLNYYTDEMVFLWTGPRFHQCLNHFPYRERCIVSSHPQYRGTLWLFRKRKTGPLGSPSPRRGPAGRRLGVFSVWSSTTSPLCSCLRKSRRVERTRALAWGCPGLRGKVGTLLPLPRTDGWGLNEWEGAGVLQCRVRDTGSAKPRSRCWAAHASLRPGSLWGCLCEPVRTRSLLRPI